MSSQASSVSSSTLIPYIASLPQENMIEILSFSDPQTLGRFCLVSRTMRSYAESSKGDYRTQHTVTSDEEMIGRITAFINKIQINQTGTFRCLFPSDPRFTVSLKLGPGGVFYSC